MSKCLNLESFEVTTCRELVDIADGHVASRYMLPHIIPWKF